MYKNPYEIRFCDLISVSLRETKCEESSISLRKAMDREPHLFFLLTDPLFQCT